MVTKSSSTTNKKSVDSVAKKSNVAPKVTEKKKTAPKKSAVVLNAPTKIDTNPMQEVLKIKAHNEEVKAIKAAAKDSKKIKTVSGSTGADKGAKAVSSRAKNQTIKETAQKAAAKKFVEAKTTVSNKGCCGDGMWAVWMSAYKKMFNFHGRTSRYEYWAFALINFLVLCFAIFGFGFLIAKSYEHGSNLTVIASFIVAFLLILAQIPTYLSLSVRRLHDTGNKAWKGFYRPLFYSSLAILVLAFGVLMLNSAGASLLTLPVFGQILLVLFVVYLFLVCIYYSTKLFVVTAFYEEDIDNDYGKACYDTSDYKAKALKYTVLYLTIITICNAFAEFFKEYYEVMQASVDL